MQDNQRSGFAWWCAATIFLSAFLLFQVQPVISKMILPWFGGSPAVWTTCLLFFQVMLLGGYAYAHWITRMRRSTWQGAIHLVLIVAALLMLPITPRDYWKPTGGDHPTWRILMLLFVCVGLPYFVLSTTGPLIQAWYSRVYPGRSPYRLYALSNIGSLGALLSYPFLFEPLLATNLQGNLWSVGFGVFAALCAWLAVITWRSRHADQEVIAAKVEAPPAKSKPSKDSTAADGHFAADGRPTVSTCLSWLLLPALASVMLLAVTNHVCQDIAVVPFLWVVPLSLYLLTFIICFDNPAWYSRTGAGVAATLSIMAVSALTLSGYLDKTMAALHIDELLKAGKIDFDFTDYVENIQVVVWVYVIALFCTCMLCHGELVRLKPAPRYLTLFYLLIAAGGALGGVLVALVCPAIFPAYYEMNLVLVGAFLLAVVVLTDVAQKTWLRGNAWFGVVAGAVILAGVFFYILKVKRAEIGHELFCMVGVALAVLLLAGLGMLIIRSQLGTPTFTAVAGVGALSASVAALAGLFFVVKAQMEAIDRTSLVTVRNFYGVLRVKEYYPDDPEEHARALFHGGIMHGYQYLSSEWRATPISYYDANSGVGLTMNHFPRRSSLRVAVVGLGTGTMAAHGQAGDVYRFYEINQQVIELADKYFTYLKDSTERKVSTKIVFGDARLSMEREEPQNYDVIVLDAFSGDAIPAHLLTKEAFDQYLRHLQPQGVICVHISNRHLDLTPVVGGLADHFKMRVVKVERADEGGEGDAASDWMLVTNNTAFLEDENVSWATEEVKGTYTPIRLWTDQYSNLYQILQ
jgi:hypothetical protein